MFIRGLQILNQLRKTCLFLHFLELTSFLTVVGHALFPQALDNMKASFRNCVHCTLACNVLTHCSAPLRDHLQGPMEGGIAKGVVSDHGKVTIGHLTFVTSKASLAKKINGLSLGWTQRVPLCYTKLYSTFVL